MAQLTLTTKDGNIHAVPEVLRKECLLFGATITPALATYFLEVSGKEFHNRQFNEDRVDRYGQDMLDGRWMHNGSTIVFTKAGVLVDGYTRLTASLMKDATFVTDVRCGIDPDAVVTIDTGRPRSLSNVLAMKNEHTSTALSQGASWLFRYKNDLITANCKLSKSHHDMVDFINNHPQIRDAVTSTKDVRNKKLAPPGVLVAAYYVCEQHNPARTREFFQLLADGVGYTATNPIKHLRDMLMQRGMKRLTPAEVFILILVAYQKFYDGESVRILRLPVNGTVPKLTRRRTA